MPDGARQRIRLAFTRRRTENICEAVMLAWFFGLNRMTKIATYIGAILGSLVAAGQLWEIAAKFL